jgi:hypothetical protein
MANDNSPNNGRSKTFELGLVMAGAVSAGAYTAGVVDFLIQALDTWQQARDEQKPYCPNHEVKLEVMAGASAGGMTAALTTAVLAGEITPMTQIPPTGPVNNKLYECWVQQIDIKPLLGDRDLGGQYIKSLLDSTVLDEIADNAFHIDPVDVPRRYVDDQLHLYLSLTNLRGVPYRITFGGRRDTGHSLSLHADYIKFVASKNKPELSAGLWLNPGDLNDANWQLLKQAALASGAFPIGLAPRLLSRWATDYGRRRWAIPLDRPVVEDDEGRCQQLAEIPPYWPHSFMPVEPPGQPDYKFLCIDGGLMNNEPLELARRQLTGPDGRNPRQASQARRTVILIDPFPNYASFTPEYEPADDIFRIAMSMFNSLRYQAQFKPDELVLAAREDVYSRFMIAPSRTEANGERALYPLACGVLGGFGGFLSEAFRQHDFQLGRRNCQQFLRRHFVLPESADNPLFDDWTDTMRNRYRVKRDNEYFLPIIPLIGATETEVERLPWPRYSVEEFQTLRRLVEARAQKLGGRMIELYIQGWLNYLARVVWWQKRSSVTNRIMNHIQASLETWGLMA